MKLDVRQLRGREVGAALDISESADKLDLSDLPELHQVSLKGALTVTGEELLLTGILKATLEQVCSRCAQSFQYRLQTELSEIFTERAANDEEFFKFAGDSINLNPMLRSVIVLNLPAAPVHSAGCAGICAVCGKDLNKEPHTHQPADDNHPFAALKKLKK